MTDFFYYVAYFIFFVLFYSVYLHFTLQRYVLFAVWTNIVLSCLVFIVKFFS